MKKNLAGARSSAEGRISGDRSAALVSCMVPPVPSDLSAVQAAIAASKNAAAGKRARRLTWWSCKNARLAAARLAVNL